MQTKFKKNFLFSFSLAAFWASIRYNMLTFMVLFSTILLCVFSNSSKWISLFREYLRGKCHCTIELLFDWFGLVCFANKNKKMSVDIQLIPNQTGGQWYSDTSPFSIPCFINKIIAKFLFLSFLSIHPGPGVLQILVAFAPKHFVSFWGSINGISQFPKLLYWDKGFTFGLCFFWPVANIINFLRLQLRH